MSALDESLFGEVQDPGDQTWFEEDWTSGDWSEDWWSDELVVAVYASDTWDDDWWWPTWDEGWSDAWTYTSWSVVQAPVEKTAPEPKATSGPAVNAVTLEPVPSSKAKAKATSKAPAKTSGLALAAVTLGSMFAGTSSCLVPSPCHDVSLGCMLEGCVDFNDFSVSSGDSSFQLPSWELPPVVYHLPHQDKLGDAADVLHPRLWKIGDLGTLTQGSLIPTWQRMNFWLLLLIIHRMKLGSCSILAQLQIAAHQTLRQSFRCCDLTRERRHLRAFLARL